MGWANRNPGGVKMCFLGIDTGTTSLKAGLFDENATARATALEEFDLLAPSEDEVEFDPEEYWSACIERNSGIQTAYARYRSTTMSQSFSMRLIDW
jgi:sugar (pentulose or hexulose) kinase